MQRDQKGFIATFALLFLVVVGTVAVYAMERANTAADSISSSISSTQAYRAARSGIEWGLYQITENAPGVCSGGTFALQNFTVSVSCSTSGSIVENGKTIQVFDLISTACRSPTGSSCPGNVFSPIYTERVATASVCWNSTDKSVC